LLCSLLFGVAASSFAQAGPVPTAIYYNATVVTMEPFTPLAQAVAVADRTIVAVGSNTEILKLKGPNTTLKDLQQATIAPGFIDPHSHMSGYGFFTDADNWLDVSSVNMFFKPLPDDPACKTKGNSQYCFIPVRNQADVVARLTTAVSTSLATSKLTGKPPAPVLAFNYDAGRLGPTPGCAGAGLACPNFENGKAREQLDAISDQVEIYVAAESGHLAYVNSKALDALNICTPEGPQRDGCYRPVINPDVEMKLTQLGQLDEDLTFYGTGHYEGIILKDDPARATATLMRAAKIYAQHGYTLIQEGAANTFLVNLYRAVTVDPEFPVTAAMVAYDPTSTDFSTTIETAIKARQAIAGNDKMLIAAVKSFADGSLPGYTAYLYQTYAQVFPPFTWPSIFTQQPYRGLPDTSRQDLTTRVGMAHAAGFPIIIHQNGDAAIEDSISALEEAKKRHAAPNLRDVVLHIPLITTSQLLRVRNLQNVAASLLMENLYYWGQPICQQVLGPSRAEHAYPAKWAWNQGLHTTMHSDSPVTPPDPLHAIWVAKTRNSDIMPWYPHADQQCPQMLGPAQSITIERALKAYTIDAAWQYGLDDRLGSIKAGKQADLAILSANPLAMESAPDKLLGIRVLATVHMGKYFAHDAPITVAVPSTGQQQP
jgi:predicted amidohydrolase YtcJ